MKPNCLLEQFNRRTNDQPIKLIDSSTSETKVFLKHKELVKLRKAFVPASCRIKFVSKVTQHSRVDERFERLYNTSPHRKIQKLKEARQSQQLSARSALSHANKRARSIRHSSGADAVKQACDKWLETKAERTLQLKHARSFCQQARDRALSFLYAPENECTSQFYSFQAPPTRKYFSVVR